MLSALIRIYQIIKVILTYQLDKFLPKKGIFRLIRLIFLLHPKYYFREKKQLDFAKQLRLALEDLGSIYIKFGQTISTRPDLFAPEIISELTLLQDKVPPFSSQVAQEIIEKAFGAPIDQLYQQFDEEALASASIAQVHGAILYSGEKVVVKILRPEIEKTVKKDVGLLYFLAKIFHKTALGKRLRVIELVKELETTLANELDLLQEASNASQLKVNFKDSDLIYVPTVYWNFCRKNIMTIERIFAVNIKEVDLMDDKAVNRKALAERGVEIFFTQVFHHSFFHADMHPGNLFVDLNNPNCPKYCAIDFGIMGSLTPEDQHYLAENFLAFFNRDYRRVAKLHIQSGWIPGNTRLTDFESAIRKVCEPIFGKPIKDISFGAFLLSLFQTAQKFQMEIQPQLILLQKTFFNIEGLGRRIYPDLDLWTTAKPILEQWLKDQIGIKALIKQLKYNAHDYVHQLPLVPLLHYQQLQNQLKNSPKNHFNYKFLGFAGILAGLILFFRFGFVDFWHSFATMVMLLISIAILFANKKE